MDKVQNILDIFDNLGINYEMHEHEPLYTVEDGKHLHDQFNGPNAKSLLLRDQKKKNFFLLVVDGYKRLDIKSISENIGYGKLSFASENTLLEKINISPGSVSPYALIYNENKDINLYIDKDIRNSNYKTFHPNDNSKTVDITHQDFQKFLEYIGYTPFLIEV